MASTINNYYASTIPAMSHTHVSLQQQDSTRLVPLDTTTPAFTHADHNPLHATSPTSIYNEVHDFQKGIKQHITLYPINKMIGNMIVGNMKLMQFPPSIVLKQSLVLIITPLRLHDYYYG